MGSNPALTNKAPSIGSIDKLNDMTVLHALFQMPLEEDVSNFLIFWSNFIGKTIERKKIDFLHCPFEIPANQHSQFGPPGLDWLCWFVGRSKGHRGK